MEFFFTDPEVERLPPTKTRLLDLRAESYPDGNRIQVEVEMTPFQQKPYLDLVLTNPDGNIVATASIVEPTSCKLALTLHIRKPPMATIGNFDKAAGISYNLMTILSYPDLGEIDRLDLSIKIPSSTV